jgi:hypothetical protein
MRVGNAATSARIVSGNTTPRQNRRAKDSDGLTALDYALGSACIAFLQQKPPVREDLAKLLRGLGATVENPNLPPWPPVPTPTITGQVPGLNSIRASRAIYGT